MIDQLQLQQERNAKLKEEAARQSAPQSVMSSDLSFVEAAASSGASHQEACAALEIVEAYDNAGTTVMGSLVAPHTSGGREALHQILRRPTDDAASLSRRVDVLRSLESADISSALSDVASGEASLVWLLRDRTDSEEALHELAYFGSYLSALNRSPVALQLLNIYRMTWCPIATAVVPLLSMLIPFFLIRYRYGIPITLSFYMRTIFSAITSGGFSAMTVASFALTLLVHFQNVMTSVEVSRIVRSVNSILWRRCCDLARLCRGARVVAPLAVEAAKAYGFDAVEFSLSTPHFEGDFAQYKGFGGALAALRDVDVAGVRKMLTGIYVVDAAHAVARSKERSGLCHPDYLLGERWPVIRAEDIWHACIDGAIKNDVTMGGDSPNNAIITGPNAGGKSTFMKAVLVGAWMAQTLGVAAASSLTLTPFSRFAAQIHVPDCKGRESLFEAEMNRCKRRLSDAAAPGFSIIAFDEMFSSTEPVEGAAAAFAVAKHLASHEGAVTLVTTHYTSLCRLADAADFENYSMAVERDASRRITFPYKLCRGVSRQHVALELLAEKGFDEELIQDALEERGNLLRMKDARASEFKMDGSKSE